MKSFLHANKNSPDGKKKLINPRYLFYGFFQTKNTCSLQVFFL